MKAAEKKRRSPRIPARHNIMLMVEGDEGRAASKEVVTTMHISRHGAHLIGRRQMGQNARGQVAHLSTCRQAPFRIAWQTPSSSQPGFHEMGIEFEDLSDFWGTSYEEPTMEAPSHHAQPATFPPSSSANHEVKSTDLDLLRTIPSTPEGRELTDAIWCGLVEQLEERRVITRGELITSLRQVGLQLD